MGKTHKDNIKVRRKWHRDPTEKVHSTRKRDHDEFNEEEALDEWEYWKEQHPEEVEDLLSSE